MSEKFDPLGVADPAVVAAAVKQRVRNVIRSYNHPADLLAEPIQNAVDEVDEAVRQGATNRGTIRIVLDCATGKVTVSDNGRGISASDIRRLLAPDVTDKAQLFMNGHSRGHKGVGLTFLSYGFNFFELESRTQSEHYKVRLEHARQWVEDSSITSVPTAEITDLSDSDGALRQPGTIITVQVGDQTEPRNLQRTFPTPALAQTVLETQTAIGVFPRKMPEVTSTFDAQLDYRAADGTLTPISLETNYRFPHKKLPKGAKTIDVGAYLAGNPPVTPPAKLTKKHESAYRFYGTDQLVDLLRGKAAEGDLLSSDADVEALLRKHGVTAYALAGYAAAYKGTLATGWAVPMNRKLVAPSIRVATDSMISSWQRDLSLSHRGFNVERIWLIVHLVGVEPDLGRKDYPPQVLELLNLLEDPLADDIATQAAPFLIPTSKSGKSIDYESPEVKAANREQEPFALKLPSGEGEIGYVTEPKEEQDVVALFNELRGLGVLSYFRPVFFSGLYAYDSYFLYEPDKVPALVEACLPGYSADAVPKRLRRGIAEFKFKAVDIVDDLARDLKTFTEVRWLVCWEIGSSRRKFGGLTIDVNEVDPGDSPYAGVTHIATLDTAGEAVVHVIALRSLLKAIKA